MDANMAMAAEEAFVERYLEFGDDDATKEANRSVLEDLVRTYRIKAEELAENLADGLSYNESDAILTIQMLSFSKKYLEKF